jgi:O-antigen/teichoic acid export membrane protein
MRTVEKDVDTFMSGLERTDRDGHTGLPTDRAGVSGPPSIWLRVRRDAVLLGAGSMGAVLTQLIFRSILIALLVPAGYGRLSLVLSIYNTVWIIGASGLPSGAARYIALVAPADDSAIVRSAFRAGAWLAIVSALVVATASAVILHSPLAFAYGGVGLVCLVYTVIIMGILRGRGRIGAATSIMPVAGVGEVLLLLVLLASGLDVTPLSAFGVFCLGNVVGLIAGVAFMRHTDPRRQLAAHSSPEDAGVGVSTEEAHSTIPTARRLLGFSLWLGLATVGIAVLPLAVRLAAALNSYTIVAIVDVALLLLSIPLRIGSVIVSAVVPHATRALKKGDANVTISPREQFIVIVPFVLAAIVVALTPIVGWLFEALGRPEYAKSSVYLALALLAGPARVLYGLVEGTLIAHGEGRFLAINSLSVTAAACVAIFSATALGSMVAAFALFVVACWAVYIFGLKRIGLLNQHPIKAI